jgi:hypothetical protein
VLAVLAKSHNQGTTMDDLTTIEVTAEDAEAYFDSTHDAIEKYLDDLGEAATLQELIRCNADLVGKIVDAYDVLLAPAAVKH